MKTKNFAIFFVFVAVFALIGAAFMNALTNTDRSVMKYAWAFDQGPPERSPRGGASTPPWVDSSTRTIPGVPTANDRPTTVNPGADPNPAADTSCRDGNVFKTYGAEACHAFAACMNYQGNKVTGDISATYQRAKNLCLRDIVAMHYPTQDCLKQYNNNEKYCEQLQVYNLDLDSYNNCLKTHSHQDIVYNKVCGLSEPKAPDGITPVAASQSIDKQLPCQHYQNGTAYCPATGKYIYPPSTGGTSTPINGTTTTTSANATPTPVSLFDLIFGTGNGQQPGGLGAWLRNVIDASVGYALQQDGIIRGEVGVVNNLDSVSFDMPGIFSQRNIDVNTNINGAGSTTTTTAGGLLDNLNIGAGISDSYAANIMRHADIENVNDDTAKSCDVSTVAPIVLPVCNGGSVAAAAALPLDNSNNNFRPGLLSTENNIDNLIFKPVNAQPFHPSPDNAYTQKQRHGSDIECFRAPCNTSSSPEQTPGGEGGASSQPSQCLFPPCGSSILNAATTGLSSKLQQQSNLGNQISGQIGGELNQHLQQQLPNQDSIRQQVQQRLQQLPGIPQINIFGQNDQYCNGKCGKLPTGLDGNGPTQ
jgi:hypothetical protein